ncbi:MAG: PAS domain-containing sensor histidine kinase [Desulfonatronovibrio sp.]
MIMSCKVMEQKFESKESLRKKAEERLQRQMPEIEDLTAAEIKNLIHDYHVHQIELEIQNEELRETQRDLEIARDRFAKLYNDSPAGYLTVDQNGIIAQANQTFADMVGREPHLLTGKPLGDFIASADLKAFHGRFKAFFKHPRGKQLDFRLCGKNMDLMVRCVGSPENNLHVRPGKDKSQHLLLALLDISGQVRAEQELRASNQRLQSILNHSPLLISEFDLDGRYLLVNPAVAGIFQLEPFQVVEKTFDELLPAEMVKIFRDRIAQVQSAASSIHVDDSLHFGREVRHFLTTLFPLTDDAGEISSIGAIAHDITERKRAEEKIKNINQQLQKANAEKDKIFSIIAHDLKSPMAGIFGTSKILASEAESLSREDIRLVSSEMHKSTENTLALLNDLMQWARMSQGGMDFSPEKCSLYELVNSSLYTARDMAARKGIAINADIPQNLVVLVDQPMINTVIRNVIFNAVKFTPQGGNISLTAGEMGSDVKLCVQDDGIGMDEAILSTIFSVDKSKRQLGTEGEKGTGLGLILCKEFVEKHGGKIWAESEPGKGAKVFFTLPAAR